VLTVKIERLRSRLKNTPLYLPSRGESEECPLEGVIGVFS